MLRQERRLPGAAVLDLCTGSGLLAVVAARHCALNVTAADLSHRAVWSARVNARLNRVRVRAVRGDLFAPVGDERFDIIVSNPPYVPNASGEIPSRGPARAWEAGSDGRALIDRICEHAPERLHPGGVLLLVHSAVCGERATRDELRARGLETSILIRHRGPLGPRLRARARWLHDAGLLPSGELEEMLVFRAERPGCRPVR
jgi:release factor glutamine methyltransferase